MARTILIQNSSLVKVGDFITFKTRTFHCSYEKILGFYIETNDIIEGESEVEIQALICPVNQEFTETRILEELSSSNIKTPTDLNNECRKYEEGDEKQDFYIWFKITKTLGEDKYPIQIDKFSLQVEVDKNSQLPYWERSVFKDINFQDSHLEKLAESLYEKIKDGNILPSFLSQEKDFYTFWIWVCYCFALSTILGRTFKDLLEDNNLLSDFLKQQDYIEDKRGSLLVDILSNSNQELHYSTRKNIRINEAGYPTPLEGYACSTPIYINPNSYIEISLKNLSKNTKDYIIPNLIDQDNYQLFSDKIEPGAKVEYSIFTEESTFQIFTKQNGQFSLYRSLRKGKNYIEYTNDSNTSVQLFIKNSKKESNPDKIWILENDEQGNEFFNNYLYYREIIPNNLIVDLALYNAKNEFINEYNIELTPEKPFSNILLNNSEVSYLLFSYPITKDVSLQINSFGEEDFFAKNKTKQELLNLSAIFNKRGTFSIYNLVKRILQTTASDGSYFGYLNVFENPFILNRGTGFTHRFKNSIRINELIPSDFIPLSTGEFVEFKNKYIEFSNNNSLSLSWTNSYLQNPIQSCLIFLSFKYKDGTNVSYSDQKSIIEIPNLPLNETKFSSNKGQIKLEIPFICISDSSKKGIALNLKDEKYLPEKPIFLKEINKKEVKFIRVDAIQFYPSSIVNKSVIGYRLYNSDSSIKSMVLNSIQKVQNGTFILNYSLNLNSGSTSTSSITSYNKEQNYAKFIFVNENKLLGFIIINVTNVFQSYTITDFSASNAISLFSIENSLYEWLNILKSSYNSLNINKAIDGSNAFANEYEDEYEDFGGASDNSSDILTTESTTKENYTTSTITTGTEGTKIENFKAAMFANCNDLITTNRATTYESLVTSDIPLVSIGTFGEADRGKHKFPRNSSNNSAYPQNGYLVLHAISVNPNKTYKFYIRECTKTEYNSVVENANDQDPSYITQAGTYGYAEFTSADLDYVVPIKTQNPKTTDTPDPNGLIVQNQSNFIWTPARDNSDRFFVYCIVGDPYEVTSGTTSTVTQRTDLPILKTNTEISTKVNFRARIVLKSLPFGLNFLNVKEYFLLYYKNNGEMSSPEAEEYISQKILPYRGVRLFNNLQQNFTLRVPPLKIESIEVYGYDTVTKPISYASKGKIIIKFSGGYPTYKLVLKKKQEDSSYTEILNQSLSTKEYEIKNLDKGTYNLILTDAENRQIIRNNIQLNQILDPDFDYKLSIIPGTEEEVTNSNNNNMYDVLAIKPKNGVPNYAIHYTDYLGNKKSIYIEKNTYGILKNYPFKRKENNEFEIEDSNGVKVKKFVTYSKYFVERGENYTEGVCQI